jgi:TnpA family transposase
MDSLLWAYLGSRRFPRELSSFLVWRFFTLSSDDRRVLRRRFRSRSRLGAALQLGFVRMTGTTLDALDYVPRSVLGHVGDQLEMSAPELTTLRALYRRPMTLFLHQRWACEYAGFHRHDASDVTHVIDGLLAGSAVTLDRHRLAQQAREALYSRRCLIPGERDIEDWVRRAICLIELQDRRYLDEAVPAKVRDNWLIQLMREKYPEPMTVLEWLRRPPRKRSRKTLDEEISKWLVIRAMTPPSSLERIPAQRLRAYARRMRRRRPIKVREIAEPRRTLEIAALLSVTAARQSDTVLRLIEMRIAEIWSWAHAVARPEPRRHLPEEVACELARVMDDSAVSDVEYREHSRLLLAPWRPGARQARRTRAAQVREHLAANARRVRPLLKHIIALDLQSVGPHPVIDALGELASSYRDDCTYLFYEPTSPAGHAWNELLRACDREQAFRAFEAATLWGVRRGLRNGSLWLPHAEQYGGQHRLLLPALRWTAARGAFLERHHLPATADPFIERVLAQIGSGCEGLNAALATGELMISPRGHVILRDDPAVTSERSDAELLRNQLYARVGRAQLTELLLAIDGETHFSWELLGRPPAAPEELVPVYAALFVAAMGLDMTDVAIMIPGVRLADIRRASRLLEEDRALRRANDVVVAFMLSQPLTKAWGEGFEASSDLMSLDVNRNLWLSRVDPKRRRHAVGTYTHVLDQWGIVYDQPLLLATRQAGAAIEGAVRQSITRLERLAVDTHGYTDFGMTIAKLLNLDLCPRLYSLRDRHLHVPRRFEVPAAIGGIVQHDVSLEPIRQGWDDLLRVAATIDEGWRSATDVLERFGSAARGDRIYQAGHALGQLLRTVYLCDYFALPDFRRPLYRVLERGESVHALQRQICTQPLPAKRGRRTEELIATSGALTLLTNCVMAWNTQRLQRAVERESQRTAPRYSIDALRSIGPVGHRHINFRGTYRFPVERYAERLVGSRA